MMNHVESPMVAFEAQTRLVYLRKEVSWLDLEGEGYPLRNVYAVYILYIGVNVRSIVPRMCVNVEQQKLKTKIHGVRPSRGTEHIVCQTN